MKPWTRKTLIALTAPLAFAGLAELAFVASGFRYPPLADPISVPLPEGYVDGVPMHARDERELWIPVPGALVPWGRDTINGDGFRGPELERAKTPGILRIAALGDSSTFGFGVEYAECWAGRLAEELGARGVNAEVIDAGVIGSTARMGLERYRVRVRPFRPDVVVAAFGAVNEHVGAMIQSDDALIQSLAFRDTVRGRWSRWMRSECELVHALAYLVDASRGGRAAIERAERERLAWQGRNLAGVANPDWKGLRRVSPAEYSASLRELHREVSADGGRLLLLAPGRRSDVYAATPAVLLYTDATIALARELAVPWVDGRAVMRAEGAEHDALFLDPYHPTPEGHRRLAAAIAEAVADLARAPR